MSDFLDRLAARRRFGMRPSLDAISGVCAALGDPQKKLRAIHVAGTNGKGAVCAMIEACLRSCGLRACRYTSPHLVRINERFFVNGKPVDDATLERAADKVFHADSDTNSQLTFFEALTAVAETRPEQPERKPRRVRKSCTAGMAPRTPWAGQAAGTRGGWGVIYLVVSLLLQHPGVHSKCYFQAQGKAG